MSLDTMQSNATPSQPQRQRRAAIKGLIADAAALGVHRTTLWRAIQGKASPIVLARYNDLLRLRSKSTTTPHTP